jgi:hypothetical protein
MISTGDITTILYRDVKAHPVFGQISEIVKDEHAPVNEGLANERIVIVPDRIDNGQIARSFPHICIYVPDIEFSTDGKTKYYRKDSRRMTELERECIDAYRSSIFGKLGEDTYTYVLDTITQKRDTETWSSFLDMIIKFEVINTKL